VSKPVNVLALRGMSMDEIIDAGARRISVGGGLTWIAVNAMTDAARSILAGDLSVLESSPPLKDWFG